MIDINEIEYLTDIFQKRKILALDKLELTTLLRYRNILFFKIVNILTVEAIVRYLIDDYFFKIEGNLFDEWLKELALFINEKVYSGWKSGIPGIDIEFDNNGIRYILTVKSGPNWANSSQISKMKADFKTAQKTLRTSASGLQIVAVNGCCYGKDKKPDKGDYFKYCGQSFWKFISGENDIYTQIIEPLGNSAKERNEEFQAMYARKINLFSLEFMKDFCRANGEIDWVKLVEFNSSEK